MSSDRKKSIEESVQEIFDKADDRKESERDPFVVDWQATLEIKILMMKKHLIKNPGQMLPMEIGDEKEWDFFYDVQEKLDLPPETIAILITPSASKNMPIPNLSESEIRDMGPWGRNAYSVIISYLNDHTVIMQVSLPGIESVGIDVFEDGFHLAEYSYHTIKECLNDLAKVIWIHFNPKGEWSDELIRRYTENWFAKGIDMDMRNVVVHNEFSYVHHPELLDMTPLESIFKIIEATVPKEYETLDKTIEIFNDYNRDFGFGDPVITKKGILQDNELERKAFYDQIEFTIDQYLDKLEDVEGIKFPDRSINNIDYRRVLDETALRIYKALTGQECSISQLEM